MSIRDSEYFPLNKYVTQTIEKIPEYIDNIPNISGSEDLIESTIKEVSRSSPYAGNNVIEFSNVRAAFAIALHQHQPLIPARGDITQTPLISNLKDMMEHPDEGDNHNAHTFKWCYERIGDFIPDLIHQGKRPRCMLEYSGTLLHGLRAHRLR